MLLAIDTSTNHSGVALYNSIGVLAECAWHSGRRHAEQLLPMIDLLLHNLDAMPGDISAVAVATGPGSWSGLRVGMSFAKALVVARELPLIGISTLDVLAYPHRHLPMPVVPMVRLGRDRYGAAMYRATSDGWGRAEPMQNLALDELLHFQGQVHFVGEVDDAARALLIEHKAAEVSFSTGMENVRRPAALAELAWQRLQANDTDEPVQLEPLYLGSPVKE